VEGVENYERIEVDRSNVESAVRNADTIMSGRDVGHKMTAVVRLQSLLEDMQHALEREDEGDD